MPGNSSGGDGRAYADQGENEAAAEEGQDRQEQTLLYRVEDQGIGCEGWRRRRRVNPIITVIRRGLHLELLCQFLKFLKKFQQNGKTKTHCQLNAATSWQSLLIFH
jgi:hypothetical protein